MRRLGAERGQLGERRVRPATVIRIPAWSVAWVWEHGRADVHSPASAQLQRPLRCVPTALGRELTASECGAALLVSPASTKCSAARLPQLRAELSADGRHSVWRRRRLVARMVRPGESDRGRPSPGIGPGRPPLIPPRQSATRWRGMRMGSRRRPSEHNEAVCSG
jgi:hypothetical protein